MIFKFIGSLKLNSGRKVRGDTILEVVFATAILSTVMIATFTILQRAIDTNLNVKNRVIALNIAREGMEAVRNIRDTNWLKYSGDRRKKWICLDQETDKNACVGNPIATKFINGNNEAAPAYYTVDFHQADERFYLKRATLQADIDFLNGAQTEASRAPSRLYITPGVPKRFTHVATGNTPTPFYRQVYLDIENPYDGALTPAVDGFCGAGDTDDSCQNSRLKVIVRTYWEEESRQRSVTLAAHLYDFFERDEY